MPDVRAFNIEAFKARFGDGAKSSLFYFQPQWPGRISEVSQEDAVYLVKTAQIASTALEEVTLNWQGFDWKFPGKHTYTDVVITFNVDLKAKIRQTFENWSNLCHDPVTNFYNVHTVYMVDQRVQLLDYDGNPSVTYTLFNAWPMTLGPIELDYAGTEVAMFDVTFSYTHHLIEENQ